MSVLMVERELKGVSMDQLGAAQKAASAGSQWQTSAELKWGTTADSDPLRVVGGRHTGQEGHVLRPLFQITAHDH